MEIIVNHLTRMRTQSRICVAGLDRTDFAHVRPVTPASDLITRQLLRENGGPFGVGALVDLGAVTPQPNPPETEDHLFHTRNAHFVEQLSAEEYWEVLSEVQVRTPEEGLGADLERRGRGYAVEAGKGTRSLAVLAPQGRPRLEVDGYGKLRLTLRYPDEDVSLSVADVRMCEEDHTTIRSDAVADVNRRLARGVDVFVMLGLARPFLAQGDDRERHYVQVNGLCMADDPVGDRP